MKRRNRSNMKKEKIIMLMSSVFVLSALTVTGVYVKEKNAAQNDGYIVDLSEMENQVQDKSDDIARQIQNTAPAGAAEPGVEEANSGNVENPGLQEKKTGQEAKPQDEASAEENKDKEDKGAGEASEKKEEDAQKDDAEEASSSRVAQAVSFTERDVLQWPISGNVLLNYSMDKTIYFPTLQQYKYNPAIVIAAEQGAGISAAATGEIIKIYEDAEIGQAVVMNLGNGYEITYGQLDNIAVNTGDYVQAGTVLGTVAAPTKYYSVEGTNVYFKLTKDGVPVNPLSRLG